MKTAVTRAELDRLLDGTDSSAIGFVPTMGALHAGHISLVEQARRECRTVVASVFLNPTQFNDPADLERYPRTPDADVQALAASGTDILFMPAAKEEVYPEPDVRKFDFGPLDKVMEGATRPGHFNGVAQVVSRLFDLVKPAKAYFGQKDFQQVAVVRAMVEMLGLPVEIISCPTVRETDGLALSSRNTLLDAAHRAAAPGIYRAMRAGVGKKDEMTPRQVEEYVAETINAEPLLEVIYFNIVNGRTLQRIEEWEEGRTDGVQGCAAVQAGAVRLIDNIRFV